MVKNVGGPANGGFGIMFRFNADFPSGDYCFCMLSWQTGGIRLACPEAGVDERISFTFAGDTWYRLRATADGATVTCEVVGAPESFAEASNPAVSVAGTVGFRATHQWADFDNIVVREITALPVFSCAGFEAPLAIGPVTVRGKRALPLKARLFDSEGNAVPDYELTAPPVVQVFFDPGDGTDPIDVTEDALPAGHGSEGNQFFFDNDGYWHFNLKTANYSAPGTYTIFIETGDDSEYLIDPTCETSFVRQ